MEVPLQKRGIIMGQAQRSDRQNDLREEQRTGYSAPRRKKQSSTGKKAQSAQRNSISVISMESPRSRERNESGKGQRPRNGAGRASGRGGRENAGRRHTNRDLQGLEMWEISRESENPRLMRLADKEQVRSTRRRQDAARNRPAPARQPQSKPRLASAAGRRKAKRRKELLCRTFMLLVIAVCLVLIYQTAGAVYQMMHDKGMSNGGGKDKSKGIVEVVSEQLEKNKLKPPAITEDFLEINDYSRPGTGLGKVKSIFVHYTANPGTTAQQNRSYFANLAQTHERSASAHFIIGYDGELIQCIPLEEQAYAVATRNEDFISIECCYQDEEGKFTQETYDKLVHTLAWLIQEYHLSTDDILRHYDCGGKLCPIYYVENEDAWDQLLADVENYEPETEQ